MEHTVAENNRPKWKMYLLGCAICVERGWGASDVLKDRCAFIFRVRHSKGGILPYKNYMQSPGAQEPLSTIYLL